MKYNGLLELKTAVMKLDTAEMRDVFIADPTTKSPMKILSHKAVWNTSKNRPACIASNDYLLIEHREAFNAVIDVMSELNIKARGNLKDSGDEVFLEVLFDMPKAIVVVKGDTTAMGVRFYNSYNLNRCFGAELFAERLVCANGMVLAHVFPDIKLRKWHHGKAQVNSLIREFITSAIDNSAELKALVNDSMEESVEWKLAEKFFETLIQVKKHQIELIKRLKARYADNKGEKLTRWDLYNVITQYSTHGKGLAKTAYTYLQDKAQKVLTLPEITVPSK